MKDARLEEIKDTLYSQIMLHIKTNNIESAARLADIYVSLCSTETPVPNGKAGFNV
jgi:hypothetical protein